MSNADNTETVTVSILDKDYKINCSPEEVTALMQSSNYVDSKNARDKIWRCNIEPRQNSSDDRAKLGK